MATQVYCHILDSRSLEAVSFVQFNYKFAYFINIPCDIQQNLYLTLLLMMNLLKCFRIVRFEALTAVTMKNGVFWDVAPCRSCVKRRFG
jgi:hypothetical protein